jgi:hypothetical protein
MIISSLTVFIIGLSLHFQNPNTVLITVLLLLNGFVASSRLEMKAIPILIHTWVCFRRGTTVAFTCSLVIKYRK